MAILKIARMGHPVLRRRLAAPQVHVPLRVVIFEVPHQRAGSDAADAEDGPMPLTVLINPLVEPLGEDREVGWEACLSVPGLSGAVPRYRRIRYAGVGLSGASVERVAGGFHARVVQHEVDHLDGVLYPMRMDDLSLLMFTEEMRHGAPEAAAAVTA
jgi:peptide deformylase